MATQGKDITNFHKFMYYGARNAEMYIDQLRQITNTEKDPAWGNYRLNLLLYYSLGYLLKFKRLTVGYKTADFGWIGKFDFNLSSKYL